MEINSETTFSAGRRVTTVWCGDFVQHPFTRLKVRTCTLRSSTLTEDPRIFDIDYVKSAVAIAMPASPGHTVSSRCHEEIRYSVCTDTSLRVSGIARANAEDYMSFSSANQLMLIVKTLHYNIAANAHHRGKAVSLGVGETGFTLAGSGVSISVRSRTQTHERIEHLEHALKTAHYNCLKTTRESVGSMDGIGFKVWENVMDSVRVALVCDSGFRGSFLNAKDIVQKALNHTIKKINGSL